MKPFSAWCNTIVTMSPRGACAGRDLTPDEWHERDERALAEAMVTGTVQPYEKEWLPERWQPRAGAGRRRSVRGRQWEGCQWFGTLTI